MALFLNDDIIVLKVETVYKNIATLYSLTQYFFLLSEYNLIICASLETWRSEFRIPIQVQIFLMKSDNVVFCPLNNFIEIENYLSVPRISTKNFLVVCKVGLKTIVLRDNVIRKQ